MKFETKRLKWNLEVTLIRSNFIFLDAYIFLGCWQDHKTRAIPTLEGKSSHLDGFYKRRDDAIKKCFEVAKSLGYIVFAVQDGGWCASSESAKSTYKKYGESKACLRNGKGGYWANAVYEIKRGTFLFNYTPCVL